MTDLTDEQLEEIKARAEAATPGPWGAIKGSIPTDDMRCAVTAVRGKTEYLLATIENGAPGDFCETEFANALFISHARDDIPALLSALKAANKRADEAEALAERLKREAVQHAQEARTANATIAEAYQAITGGAGEPGNWQGAEPIKAELTRLREEIGRYRELPVALVGRMNG